MSGHSKWATIHRQKEVKDSKRGAVFTKLGNAITIAVREGGGTDPEGNFKLRLVIDKAKQANMPKENIQRAIDKGAGSGSGVSLEQITYEGFGPGGVAILIEVATDNRNRTMGEVRNVLERGGGHSGSAGSVSYLFEKKGLMVIECEGNSDDMVMRLIDLGVDDIELVEGELEVYCEAAKLYEKKLEVQKEGMGLKAVELTELAKLTVPVTGEAAQKLRDLLEKLEDLDDVQKVYTNAELS